MKTLILEIGLWFVSFSLKGLLRHLPLKLNYSLAHLSSLFFYLFLKKRRDIVKEEITRLFGERIVEKDRKRVVRKSFSIFLKRQVENVLFGEFSDSRLDNITSIEGVDNLNRSLQGGKGVIMLLSHFGSFLLPPPFLGYMGYKVFQVAGKPLLEGRNPIHEKLFKFRKRESDKLPIHFIQTDRYLGPIVRALKSNGIVVIAFDGRTGNKWIPVKLFDRTAEFSPGPFDLAIRSGATIVPTFVVRRKDNINRIIYEPPLRLEITGDKEETWEINTIKYTRIFERYLLTYPCHFAMTLYTVRMEAEKGLNRSLFID